MTDTLPAYGWRTADAHCHHAYILPAIETLLPEQRSLRILDLGCGNGFLAQHFAAAGHAVTATDPSTDGIELARRAYPGVRFEAVSGYDSHTHLMPPGGWDVITASEVIEHLYDPRRFLENAFRHIAPGGCIILTTPYHGYLKNLALAAAGAWDRHLTVHWHGGHIKFFSVPTLTAMLRDCGFVDPTFRFVGRLPWLWKSMVCRAEKPTS
jgi:2-polyprenyl-6-hydroxyphenyl methylase/3-demethylubiquinone-9 3-methyltransferase